VFGFVDKNLSKLPLIKLMFWPKYEHITCAVKFFEIKFLTAIDALFLDEELRA